jgi:hypothetical protein
MRSQTVAQLDDPGLPQHQRRAITRQLAAALVKVIKAYG